MQTTLFAITDRNAVMQGNRGRIEESCDSWDFPFGVNKEVVGIHVLLTRLLFACDILRRLLLHVSLVKPTSLELMASRVFPLASGERRDLQICSRATGCFVPEDLRKTT